MGLHSLTPRFEQVPPGLVFVPVAHDKHGKNRLHLDLAPHVSVGQDADATWEVLADPDGNEFCMLSAREC